MILPSSCVAEQRDARDVSTYERVIDPLKSLALTEHEVRLVFQPVGDRRPSPSCPTCRQAASLP